MYAIIYACIVYIDITIHHSYKQTFYLMHINVILTCDFSSSVLLMFVIILLVFCWHTQQRSDISLIITMCGRYFFHISKNALYDVTLIGRVSVAATLAPILISFYCWKEGAEDHTFYNLEYYLVIECNDPRHNFQWVRLLVLHQLESMNVLVCLCLFPCTLKKYKR